MSIKIPPIVIVDPTEIFNVTETAISNVVTKDFLVKKSGNSNHQIFLQSLDDYNATGNLLVGEVLHVYSPFGENHVVIWATPTLHRQLPKIVLSAKAFITLKTKQVGPRLSLCLATFDVSFEMDDLTTVKAKYRTLAHFERVINK